MTPCRICGAEERPWPDWCCDASLLLPALRLVVPLLAGSKRPEDMDEVFTRATISFAEGEVTFGLLPVEDPKVVTLAEVVSHREALGEMGLVRWNGTYRNDSQGVPQKVWVAVPRADVTNPEGLAFLEEVVRDGTD